MIYKDRNILFYAFRYALGRQTYVVSEVVEAIIDIWGKIPASEQLLYKKEITKAILDNKAGMEMDIAQWQHILDLKVN